SPSHRLVGADGLREVVDQLNGFEAPAGAWERAILPARVEPYESPLLDTLCLTGEVSWARTSPPPSDVAGVVAATPIALFPREHAALWAKIDAGGGCDDGLDEQARAVVALLRQRGASFAPEIAAGCRLTADQLQLALAGLVASGLITSDGFGGLRALLRAGTGRRPPVAGRWCLTPVPGTSARLESLTPVPGSGARLGSQAP